MKKFIRGLGLTILLILIFFCSVSAKENIPKRTILKYVNDYTNTLNLDTKEYVVSLGKELEDKTGAQATVVIINSLEGQDIESYANNLFRKWGIGQKEKNNGLLILVSLDDRKRRVEVGDSLEGVLPDLYTHNIMEKFFKPYFKEKKYDEGIKQTYSAFAEAIAKEYNVKLDRNIKVNLPSKSKTKNNEEGIPITKIIGIVAILIIIDKIFNKGRIIKSILEALNDNHRNGPGGFGSGGFGGGFGGFGGFYDSGNDTSGGFDDFGDFGGGSSSGGGSSGDW